MVLGVSGSGVLERFRVWALGFFLGVRVFGLYFACFNVLRLEGISVGMFAFTLLFKGTCHE